MGWPRNWSRHGWLFGGLTSFVVSFLCKLFLIWDNFAFETLVEMLWIVAQRSEDLGLFVIHEDNNEMILSHRISSDDIYHKQEGIFLSSITIFFSYLLRLYLFNLSISDTIISWRDPELSTELALSFKETTGCSYIWQVSNRSYLVYHSSFLYEFHYTIWNAYRDTFVSICVPYRDHICTVQRNMHFRSLAGKWSGCPPFL